MADEHNILNLLEITDQIFATLYHKSLKNGMLSLIARPSCGRFILRKKTTTTWSLACLSYTTSLQNSKTNSSRHEKAMNAATGLSTPSLRSWCRSLLPKRPISCDVSTSFSGTPALAKNDFTLSWLHPRFLGNDCGKGCGR